MQRDEEFRTPLGQAAWIFYQKWLATKHRQTPKASSFLHSKLYNSFIRFAKFIKKVHLPDPELFVWLMVQKDFPPVLWCSDQVYAEYLEFIDRRGDPKKQAENTINTLFNIAEAADVNVGDVFNELMPNEVIQLLRQRRLSPWILLNSKKFTQFFVDRTNSEEQIIIESIIRPTYWGEKFQADPKAVELMRKYVSELNL